MQTSQTERGLLLIGATLYKRQKWYPTGLITFRDKKVILKKAYTQFNDSIIYIDFQTKKIFVDGRQQKMRKETALDLMNLVRLKLTKKLKSKKNVQ